MRFLRIAPGFVFSTVVITILLCPFFSTSGSFAFLFDPNTWSELLRVLTFQSSGISYTTIAFFKAPPDQSFLPHVANGVLWTIRLEAICYVVVGIVSLVGLLGARGAALTMAGAMAILAGVHIFPVFCDNEIVGGLSLVAPSFATGMMLRALAANRETKGYVAGFCTVALVAAALLLPGWAAIHQWWLFPILAAYPLLWVGQLDCVAFRRLRETGDLSYGTYLWGWPVQMVVRSIVGEGWPGWLFATVCLPFVLLIAWMSWHWIERPALHLKWTRRQIERLPESSIPDIH